MNKLFLLVFLLPLILFGSCSLFEDKVDDEIDEGEVLEIKDQELSFSIFQIASIDLGETTFSDGQIEGTTLEGVKIPLYLQENSLTFMVPKLNQGSYKLVFSENNKPFNISFEVKPFALKESPQTVLASYRKKAEDKIQALERTKDLMSGESKIAYEKDLELLKKGTLEQFELAATLNESELTEMALFLLANEQWLQEVSDAVEVFSSSLPNARILNENPLNREDQSNRIMLEYVTAVIKVVANINKVVVSGLVGAGVGLWKGKSKEGFGLGFLVGALVGKFLFLKDYETLIAKMNQNLDLIDLVMLDSDMNANQRASFVFQNDIKTELIVDRNYRKLYKEDAISSIEIVKNFVLKYKEMIQAFSTLKEATNANLSYQPDDFTQKTEFQTTRHQVHSDHLSISGITNPKVIGSVTKENGRLFLTFKTEETDAQEFDFKLTYENQDFGKLEKNLDAAVINSGCSVKLELKDKNILTATATGYGPFKFVWSSGENVTEAKTHAVKMARFGDYSVTVTDQNGCESKAIATVPCTLKIDVLNSRNTFTIEVLDGFPPYYYTWSNNTFTKTQTLPPGSHSVTIRDGLGCEILHTVTIGCNLAVNIQKDGNNVIAQPTGGTPPFTYTWSNGATTASQSNLAPGTYSVVVKDKVGCEKSASVTISCNMAVSIQKDGNNVTAQPTGGTAPYTYAWSNGATTASQSILSGGTYSVVVKDQMGCEKTQSINIEEKEPEYGSYTDPRDGNVYKTVKIGNQTWFAENLKYQGNIPKVISTVNWAVIWNNGIPTGQQAWISFMNDLNNHAIYGKLYNWYAVNFGSPCPPGWHIPTDTEWTVLSNFLGGDEVSGGKLKSVTGWGTTNSGATNGSGFTASPGGFRTPEGIFYDDGAVGVWWTSSSDGSISAWVRKLRKWDGKLYRGSWFMSYGASCRCLKD